MIDLLTCPVMPYAWGSTEAIARLQGRPPSPSPEAELWMGAHPSAPARLVRNHAECTLFEVVDRAPERELGSAVTRAFAGALPFLLKVLAAEEPLSLQAHPSEVLARAGFADEEARGVPRAAPHRNYKDPSHKPELLCALTPFDALVGFRRVKDTLSLFDTLGIDTTRGPLASLRGPTEGRALSETFRALMTAPEDARARLVANVVSACEASSEERFARERTWTMRLAKLYPGDIGVVSAMLLNVVHLEPGQAIYLDAGNLHAYLGGVGVEIMASSDNVLRGGLTKKHVDVTELMRVLVFEAGPISPIAASRVDDVESVYETPAREFRLSVLRPHGQASRVTRGPEILLCVEGAATISSREGPPVRLASGAAAFVSAETERYELEGEGVFYRATVNL